MLKIAVIAIVGFALGVLWLKRKVAQDPTKTDLCVGDYLEKDANTAVSYAQKAVEATKTKLSEVKLPR
jgi:hypothetical protein